MKKKGFTLIELLAAVVILGILLVIAVPTITKYLNRGKVEYYHSLEKEIKTTGMDYLETYRTLLPRKIGNVTVIDLEELMANKYIDEVKDEEGNLCKGKVTVKKVKTGKYEYYSCLECGDKYKTEGNSCNYSEEDNTYVDQEDYDVILEENSKRICQADNFILPYGKAYYKKEELVSDKVEGRPNKIDTNKLGRTEVKYSYHGASEKLLVEVVDCTKPEKPEVVLKKDNATGESYVADTWSNKSIYQKFKSTDYTMPGVMGSGIKEYLISETGIGFEKVENGDYVIEDEAGEHIRWVKSIDKAGNESGVTKYTFKIDKEVPTCEIEVTSGTEGLNGWYTSNDVTLKLKTEDKVSGEITSNISHKTVTKEGKTTVTALVTDKAGNIGSCSKVIKIDTIKPSCSFAGENSNWTKSDVTVTATCNDNTSGCTSENASNQWKFNSGTHGIIESLSYEIKDNAGHINTCSKKDVKVYLDKEGPTTPTIGAIGNVSGSSTTGSVKTAASGSTDKGVGEIVYKYIIKTNSTTPSNSDTGFTTSKNFTRSCGTTYYAWAIAEDKFGNRSDVKYLGTTSDGANSYSAWGSCSKTCGGGTQTRTNTCLLKTDLSQSCNVQSCDVKYAGPFELNCGSGKLDTFDETINLSSFNKVSMEITLNSFSENCTCGATGDFCWCYDTGLEFIIGDTEYGIFNISTLRRRGSDGTYEGGSRTTCYSGWFASGNSPCAGNSNLYSSADVNTKKTVSFDISTINGNNEVYFNCPKGHYGYTGKFTVKNIIFSN